MNQRRAQSDVIISTICGQSRCCQEEGTMGNRTGRREKKRGARGGEDMASDDTTDVCFLEHLILLITICKKKKNGHRLQT